MVGGHGHFAAEPFVERAELSVNGDVRLLVRAADGAAAVQLVERQRLVAGDRVGR